MPFNAWWPYWHRHRLGFIDYSCFFLIAGDMWKGSILYKRQKKTKFDGWKKNELAKSKVTRKNIRFKDADLAAGTSAAFFLLLPSPAAVKDLVLINRAIVLNCAFYCWIAAEQITLHKEHKLCRPIKCRSTFASNEQRSPHPTQHTLCSVELMIFWSGLPSAVQLAALNIYVNMAVC